jgi:hypothetical protein
MSNETSVEETGDDCSDSKSEMSAVTDDDGKDDDGKDDDGKDDDTEVEADTEVEVEAEGEAATEDEGEDEDEATGEAVVDKGKEQVEQDVVITGTTKNAYVYLASVTQIVVLNINDVRTYSDPQLFLQLIKDTYGNKYTRYGYMFKDTMIVKSRSRYVVTKNSKYSCTVVYETEFFNLPIGTTAQFIVIDIQAMHAIIDIDIKYDNDFKKIIYVPLQMYKKDVQNPLKVGSIVNATIMRKKLFNTTNENTMTYTALINHIVNKETVGESKNKKPDIEPKDAFELYE